MPITKGTTSTETTIFNTRVFARELEKVVADMNALVNALKLVPPTDIEIPVPPGEPSGRPHVGNPICMTLFKRRRSRPR